MEKKEKLYNAGIILIFALGFILRLVMFLQNQSMWGDETALAINLIGKSYSDLLHGLDYLQAAPACFAMIAKFVLNSVNPAEIYYRDMVLRVLPFVSGILAMPVFYYLAKLVFRNNKKCLITALFFFFLHPCAIIYSAQLKQYSTELLVSTGLMLIFWKMIFQSKNKTGYAFLVAAAPWFSYSSFFVIAAGFLALLFKNWKQFIKPGILFFISCIVYYFVSLKSVFAVNYSDMQSCWTNCYGFMDLRHPLRLFIHYGSLFAQGKIFSAFAGMALVTAIIKYAFEKDNLYKKILILVPVFLTLVASLMHKYPIMGRLILFLLPMFSIAIASLRGKSGILIKGLMALVLTVALFCPQVTYSCSREIADYLKENIKPNDILVMNQELFEYDFYLEPRIQNRRIVLPVDTCDKKHLKLCRELLQSLPSGSYYFLTSGYLAKEVVENQGYEIKELDLGFKPKRCKAVYFRVK